MSAKQAFLAVLLFSMCINFLMLAAPIHMLQIFDRVLSSRSTDTLLLLSVITVIAILTLALLDAIRSNVMIRVGAWLDQRLGGMILSGSIVMPLRSGTSPSIQGLRDLSTFRTFLSGSEIFSFMDSPWAPHMPRFRKTRSDRLKPARKLILSSWIKTS